MITIVKRPERFTPASNAVIWQVTSNDTDLVNFKVSVIDDDTDAIINTLDIFPTPAYPQGSYINVSKLLSNVVNWELSNDSYQFIVPMQKTIRSYRLKITERILDNGAIINGTEYNNTSDINFIFNAELSRITSHNFLQTKYVIGTSNVVSFMTEKPNHTKVNDISGEQLYFMQDGTVTSLFARVRFYDTSGSLLDIINEQVLDLDEYKMFRLNVSPKAVKDSHNIDFTSVAYYVVDLIDHLGAAKSTERIYLYEAVKCHQEYINLMWVNALGGIDSYSFIAPQDTINVNRFQLKKNTFGINSDNEYSDMNDNIYNPSDVIINNNVSTQTKIHSQELKDGEAVWLQGLYTSKQVFVELTDLSLVPVIVNNTSYTIPKLKMNRGNLQTISLDITLADGIIPTGVQSYGGNRSSIEFIDSQLNTLFQNLPGYDLTVVVGSMRHYSDNYGPSYA